MKPTLISNQYVQINKREQEFYVLRKTFIVTRIFCHLFQTTGLLVGAMKRFQVNIALYRNKMVKGFRKLPTLVFPILWGEEVKQSLNLNTS